MTSSIFQPRHIALAAMSALLPTLAAAQAAPAAPAAAASAPEATLPAVPVRAAAERESASGPVQGYAARRSATATKTDTPLNEVPQSISVISAEQIRDQAAQTMQEVLRYTPGVRSEMYGLDNRGDWFTLRGGSEGSVLLDGLRVPLTGWYGVVRNEPYAFERIEVLRGPSSLVAGQNGPGGVVNMVSKRPQAEAQREVAVQLGNHRHQQIAADLGGPLNADGTLLYRLVALHKDSGTQVDHADDERSLIAPSLTWQPSAATRVTLFAEYQKDRTGNTNAFFPIEGTLRPAPNGKIPYDTFIGEPDWDRYGGERKRLGYHVEHRLGADWKLRHNLRHDRIDGGMRTMYAAWWLGFADASGAPDANGSYLNRIYYATDNHARITNGDLLFEGQLDWGGVKHTLLAGIDALRGTDKQRAYTDGAATPLDVYNPVYGSFPEPDWSSLGSSLATTQVRNTGVLLQDQMKFGERWVVVAGLRHDRARTNSDTDGAAADPQKDAATSKSLGVVYRAGAWSPYAGYSESFEPVAGRAWGAGTGGSGGAAFDPKRGKQIEAGIKWAPDERISAAAAIYKLKETNRLTEDTAHPNFQVQLGEVTVDGIELEVAANLRAWDLVASYSYTDARLTRANGADAAGLGKQISGVPKQQAALWALHKFAALPGLKAGAGVRHAGKSSDGLDITTTPAVTLLDLMASYETGPWRMALNVANATDKTYIATCLSRGDCWFGTKRKAIATVSYRW